jgi:voltage-gated potassium channel
VERGLTARRVAYVLLAAVAVLVMGTVGFHLIIDEGWLQSFYRAVVTSSLTGLDTVPGQRGGMILSIVLVLSGVTIFAFVGAAVVETIARGVFTGALAERRRRRAIQKLRNHTIICGYGRVGQRVAEEFRRLASPFVVLDSAPEAGEAAAEAGDLFVPGDATEDEDLRAAGLAHASALVAALDSDADNLYVAMSARAIRPGLLVVARASDEDAERKLLRAGADRVVMPYATAGRVMAGLVLKPQVTSFLNVATLAGGTDLQFEQIEVSGACRAVGQSIRELEVRERTGASIVAVSKKDGEMQTRPGPDTVLGEGDVLIGVGTSEEIRALEDLFAPAGAHAS